MEVPPEHLPFWQARSVENIFSTMTASPEKVSSKIIEPDFNNTKSSAVHWWDKDGRI
jgi:hypothetical protein